MTLNPSQLKAVNLDTPLIVVPSGPGSGKTRTAVARTARLLRAGRSVLVLTFTNSGASEFRSRILEEILTPRQSTHSVYECTPRADFLTLHAYCFRLIRRHGHLIGYTSDGVSMLPPGDADELLEEVRDSLGVKVSLPRLASQPDDPMIQQVWTEYRFRLKRNNLVDYDRILFDGLALLGFDKVREAVAVDDLIIEEAQDSAAIDWSIYNAIPAKNRFIIGDSDQSLFEFRAAYPEGFLNIIKSAGAYVLPLEENYRCAARICTAANNLIKHNKSRYEKDTIPVAPSRTGVITVEGFDEPRGELVRLVELLSMHVDRCQSVAVLCRTNYGVKQIRDFLMSIGLPVHTAHSRGRFNPPHDWRLATLLIALIVSPYNEIIVEQLLRLNHPRATVTQWKLEARANGESLCDRFDGARAIGTREQVFHYLAVNGVSEGTLNLILERCLLLQEDASLADLLQDLHGRDLFDQQQPADTIYTGTIHSAKGREFDVVFLPMFEQGIIPSNRIEEIEESRRLAFVAITRARTHVHISWCSTRNSKWGGVHTNCQPSQFISEMGL